MVGRVMGAARLRGVSKGACWVRVAMAVGLMIVSCGRLVSSACACHGVGMRRIMSTVSGVWHTGGASERKAAGASGGMIGALLAHSGTMASILKLSPSIALTQVMFSNMSVALMLWRNGKERIVLVAIALPRANVTMTGRP